ncbi:MAG: chemotaxis-specific protein-glutamate methyltransferase CheB [Treponema sp.]|nr:chemotaxis-specific protein-glutamate methyltransferase CheB [Treponema sp.]MCL2237209.1 chemotaxis-specific protein-glutamate methyltransferase CheB [Treponema sp.]
MIKTIIIDDSTVVRQVIRDFLEEDGNFEIVAEAGNGEEGAGLVLSLNPDLVTTDIEMPKMNGLEMIEKIMGKQPIPIVVISSHDSAKAAYDAAMSGALEFYSKDIFMKEIGAEKKQNIYNTLKRISGVKARIKEHHEETQDIALSSCNMPEMQKTDMVVIASSTGGPKALSQLFSNMPENFPAPIAVVQHNSFGFDEDFTKWLDTFTKLNVKLAEDNETPKAGNIYIARTDKHLELKNAPDLSGYVFCYNDNEPEQNQKPAADVLFRTAAQCCRESLVSVVLTGMGADGAQGTQKVKESSGITIAQDEKTSLIYGMPKAAFETGCVDKVLPLEQISLELVRLAK